jgi:hypothetical protein
MDASKPISKKTLDEFVAIIEEAPKMFRKWDLIKSLRCRECYGTKFDIYSGKHSGEAVLTNPPRMCSHNNEEVDPEHLPDWVHQRAFCGCCGYLG